MHDAVSAPADTTMIGQFIHRNQCLRATLAGWLVAAILACTIGEYLVFKSIQFNIRRQIKTQIKASIPEEKLVWIAIATAQAPKAFQFLEKDEFRYHGKMYDIVKQEERGDSTYFLCIDDEKETALFANLQEAIQQEWCKNPQHHQHQKQLSELIPKFYFFSDTRMLLFDIKFHNNHIPFTAIIYSPPMGRTVYPPPER